MQHTKKNLSSAQRCLTMVPFVSFVVFVFHVLGLTAYEAH